MSALLDVKGIAIAFGGLKANAAAQAQAQWKLRPLSERAAFCSDAVDAMLSMRDEIVRNIKPLNRDQMLQALRSSK